MKGLKFSSEHTDQQLFTLVCEGDDNAFAEFFRRRADGIYVIINKIIHDDEVARDLLQDVFVKAWLNRESLIQMDNPAAWLLKTATNLAIDHLRRKELEFAWLKELKQNQDESIDINKYLYDVQISRIIADAVNMMPEQRKKVYQLSRGEGLSRQEIAGQLGISEHTVKNHLGAALKFIHDHLLQQGVIISDTAVFFILALGLYKIFS